MSDSLSDLSEETLTEMILESNTTMRNTEMSTAAAAERVSAFIGAYEKLKNKPDTEALIYKDSASGEMAWVRINDRLVVGRFPKPSGNAPAATLGFENDQEMSKTHFEIVRDKDGLYVLTDLESKNGTLVNGVEERIATLIAGTQIRAGNTQFIFAAP